MHIFKCKMFLFNFAVIKQINKQILTFKDHLVQPPCHGQVLLPQDQAAQSPIQPDLEHIQ